jgi:hypothetical protein
VCMIMTAAVTTTLIRQVDVISQALPDLTPALLDG